MNDKQNNCFYILCLCLFLLDVSDILEEHHIVQKLPQEKEASIELLHDVNQIASDNSFEHLDAMLNDGFISPTAWQTRSRRKGYYNVRQQIIFICP